MITRSELCRRFGLEHEVLEDALAKTGPARGVESPWYVTLALAVGAWLTVLVLLGFSVALVTVFIDPDLDNPSGPAFALGAVFLGVGLPLARSRSLGRFAEQLADPLSLAGVCLLLFASVMEFESAGPGAVIAGGFSALAAVWRLSGLLQGFAAILAVIFLGAWIGDLAEPHDGEAILLFLAAVILVATAHLLFGSARVSFKYGSFAALLLAALWQVEALFHSWLGFTVRAETGSLESLARALHFAALILPLTVPWRLASRRQDRRLLLLVGLGAAVITLLLPAAGSAALPALVLAVVSGLRPLAILGSLLEVYFISQYYYSLEMTLLQKSLVMMAVGLLLLGLWTAFLRLAPGGKEALP